MTRLLTRCFFLGTILVFFSLSSCEKDKTTTVNGTLVDKFTGMPIFPARIDFSVYYKDNQSPNNYDYPSVSVGENGQFIFSSIGELQIYGAAAEGYLTKGLGPDTPRLIQGKINEIKLEMIPLDGVLKLIVKNNGQANKFYVGGYSPLKESEYGFTHGTVFRDTIFIENASEVKKVVNLASEETISIFWSLSPLPYDLSLLPSQGSVFITRTDTTTFNISF